MCLFKQNLYKVAWSYDPGLSPITELIKARDMGHAWEKLKKQHCFPITLVSIEKVDKLNA